MSLTDIVNLVAENWNLMIYSGGIGAAAGAGYMALENYIQKGKPEKGVIYCNGATAEDIRRSKKDGRKFRIGEIKSVDVIAPDPLVDPNKNRGIVLNLNLGNENHYHGVKLSFPEESERALYNSINSHHLEGSKVLVHLAGPKIMGISPINQL